MKGSSSYYAIVTGSSQGLGRALAEELARRGHNLILAALPGTGLPEMSERLARNYGVTVHTVETDLMRPEAPEEIAGYVKENALEVDILVNNVGIGHGGRIGDYSDRAVEESIFLNMRCATLMTNLFTGELSRRRKSHILNIGSFGGFLPIPYKSIYAASKSFIYHFSLAVREEMKANGVSVSVAMPGGIITNQKVRERVANLGTLGKMNAIEPDSAAHYILERMFRGKAVIITGRSTRIAYRIGTFLPFIFLMPLAGKIFRGVN